MKCPECHYIRKRRETVPEWQCPNCGIAYNKHPDYFQTYNFKIKLLYKIYPKNKEIKAHTIYVYLYKNHLNIEHIQFAFLNKDKVIIRLGLGSDLFIYSAEIFEVLNSTSKKLPKLQEHHKKAIIEYILPEYLKDSLPKDNTKKSNEIIGLPSSNKKYNFYSVFLNRLSIVVIIGTILFIYYDFNYYIIHQGLGFGYIYKSQTPEEREALARYYSQNNKIKTSNAPNKNIFNGTFINSSLNDEGDKGLSKLLGENGEQQNIDEGIRLLTQSAERGNRKSQYNLGMAYYEGYGLDNDKKKALFWLIKAAENGEEKAQYNVGIMYLRGEGTIKNKNKALYWIKKSADQGFTPAINLLSQIKEVNEKPIPVYEELPSHKLIYKKEDKNGTLFTDSPN
ncbi:TPR repeat protein [Legionella steelei]|uniref:TPR repeat protein n=1 Tax=Legionella steelei TaxID=947033 RepID=A0A0W0ZFK3_9GAMM|nr:SEL1-like repeat protein [Legionella steelei]KTD67973.1 TPR repeat protein [Legionella steelei]